MIYRNEATGRLVRVHRVNDFLSAGKYEQEDLLTGERTELPSLEILRLVRDE